MTRGREAGASGDLLEAVLAATRHAVEVRRASRSLTDLARAARGMPSRAVEFEAALARPDRVNVIAECKRRSPSRGVLRADYDAAALARMYEQAGAAAVSVLTEPAFFDGTLDHLRAVRQAVALPLLRKDFIIDEYQIAEARAAGADAVLLIVAALDQERLGRLLEAAGRHELAALVEVHDAGEVDRAAAAGARIVGVNNRNLRTLSVDLEASHTLIRRLPRHVVAVAESGLQTPDDLRTLRAAGYRAFLVGEHLVRSDDPRAALEALRQDCGLQEEAR